jgi:hypothetical protein
MASGAIRFSTFDVSRQVFFRSKLSVGIVNLKPIVDNRELHACDCTVRLRICLILRDIILPLVSCIRCPRYP